MEIKFRAWEKTSIDRLVAEKVMGWKIDEQVSNDDVVAVFDEKGNWGTFKPTEWIQDAWQVVEKMKLSNFSARHRFVTELQKEITPKELKDKNQLLDLGWMIFYLTPKSICLAALKAVGLEVEVAE